jgi:cation diffusion facilitator CzcD-associated flavoprotein CzcO
VLEVDPVVEGSVKEKEDSWKVTVRDELSGQIDTSIFDFIMICNGCVYMSTYLYLSLDRVEFVLRFSGAVC